VRFALGNTWLLGLLSLGALPVFAKQLQTPEDSTVELELIEVSAQRVANTQSAGTFATSVTQLRFDPQIDIQARNLAEGQADTAVKSVSS